VNIHNTFDLTVCRIDSATVVHVDAITGSTAQACTACAYYRHLQEEERDAEARQEHEQLREEIRNKNLEEINVLRITLDTQIEELEQHFETAHINYLQNTDQRTTGAYQLSLCRNSSMHVCSHCCERRSEGAILSNSSSTRSAISGTSFSTAPIVTCSLYELNVQVLLQHRTASHSASALYFCTALVTSPS
jgi:hypothetical protein